MNSNVEKREDKPYQDDVYILKDLQESISSIMKILSNEDIEEITGVFITSFNLLHLLPSDLNEMKKVIISLKSIFDEMRSEIEVKNVENQVFQIIEKLDSLLEKIPQKIDVMLIKVRELLHNYYHLTPKEFFVAIYLSGSNGEKRKIIQALMEVEEDIREILNKVSELEKHRSDLQSFASYRGREFKEIISKLREAGREISDFYRLSFELEEKIRKIKDTIFEIISKTNEVSLERIDSLFMISNLRTALPRGLWASDIVNTLTGLNGVHAELALSNVFLHHPRGSQWSKGVSLDELFYRYSPYEPLAERILVEIKGLRVPISGCYTWFILGKNLLNKSDIRKVFGQNLIIKGDFKSRGPYMELKEVDFINILNETRNGFIDIIISVGRRRVRIRYGSRGLLRILDQFKEKAYFISNLDDKGLEQKIQEFYEDFLAKRREKKTSKAYLANDLTYAWYCILGYGMSTDPWDVICPFADECPIMIDIRRRKEECRYWSWSRRLFPKIFSTTDHIISNPSSLKVNNDEQISVLKPVIGKHIFLSKVYRGIQWNMPAPANIGTGPSVKLEFDNHIIQDFPMTNVIGIALPYDLIKSFIVEIVDPYVTPKPEVKVSTSNLTTTLDKLLLSKFFFWQESAKGSRTFTLLEKRTLIDTYNKFVKKVYSLKELYNDFVEFCIDVFAHSFAHLLHSYVSQTLGIDPNDLTYLYMVDEERDLLLILIAENSPLGTLNLVDHSLMVHGSMLNLINSFISEVNHFLKEHTVKVREFLIQDSKYVEESSPLAEKMKILIEKVKSDYKEMVRNGLVLDEHLFAMHLLLSGKYMKMAEESQTDIKEAYDSLGYVLGTAGILYCLDGCPSCIMLEHGCKEQAIQGVCLSKELFLYFLNIFFNEETITARGDRFGKSLLMSLPQRSLSTITPYIDEEGIRLIEELVKKGVTVTILTRHESAVRIARILKDHLLKGNIKVRIPEILRHEKLFIINDNILIETTWNLTLGSTSTNHFSFKIINKARADALMSQIPAKNHVVEVSNA